MSSRIDSIFHALVCVASFWLVMRWAAARFQFGRRRRRAQVAFGLIVVVLPFISVGSLPFWNWAFSFCPSPGVIMLGLIGAALGQQLLGVALLKPADWRAAWIFGAVTGTLLYFHPIPFAALDLYYWGWHELAASLVLATVAILFLAWGNRLGVLLLAALIACKLNVLESRNCWDYVVDPYLWLIGTGWVGVQAYRRWRRAGALRVTPTLGARPQAD